MLHEIEALAPVRKYKILPTLEISEFFHKLILRVQSETALKVFDEVEAGGNEKQDDLQPYEPCRFLF